MSKENYFPFGFRYPAGLPYDENDPDPMIEAVKERMAYLNKVYQKSSLPGHIFAAALDLFQKESFLPVDKFWEAVQKNLSQKDVAQIAEALAPKVANEPPRLEFPNAIALFDCRFVATKEWERIRRFSIGGSEVPTILGLSHFQSKRTLYFEKTTRPPDNDDITWRQILDYGHKVEDYVISETASRLGAVRYPEHRMFAHREYPYLTCNPDGILIFPDGSLALFEAKTAMWLKEKDWKYGIPDYYAPQPKHYMEVLDDPRLTHGYIGVCLGGLPKNLRCHRYERDPVAGAEQIAKVVEYWNEYIVPQQRPEFSGNPELDMTALYHYIPHDQYGTSEETLDPSAQALFERYFELQEQKKNLDKEIREIKKKEDALLLDIRSAAPEGLTICTKPGSVTYTIKVKDSTKRTVNSTKLRSYAADICANLEEMAKMLKGSSDIWATPAVSKAISKKN